jgi:hypothetical protein
VAGRAHRLAGAVHLGGDLGGGRRGLRIRETVQRLLRARRLLRGHDDASQR